MLERRLEFLFALLCVAVCVCVCVCVCLCMCLRLMATDERTGNESGEEKIR